ncbi:CBS domain-containing protein [Corynebacterium glucuronolyticum]|uniref:CBS domain-containing protein n=1 Tax=Corynebacterium glucuronolyticum TaxID=39791 RepID=A0A7T4EE17_9CORY|nr:CBS domain-containing protein [Corynebacterium glucuronolyticum]QQB45649.1 CBS domain-containing protein [Corynebacterium glucuronolyticum]WKD63684.1 CBS domain protein [Corynebacterium glucuronolyticum DSM 44120]SMB80834.1 CBS domain-containing protein [Corynebacterium glucuronolyticum]
MAQNEDPALVFLTVFNNIEATIRRLLDAKPSDSLTWMVRLCEKKRIITPAQSDTLQAAANLRNSITHGSYLHGEPVADPREDIINDISAIYAFLTDPPLALSVLPQKDVVTFAPDTSVRNVLAKLRSTRFSQFPIYEGRTFIGVLTANSIAKWLAEDILDDGELSAISVQDVLDRARDSQRVAFLPRTATSYNVAETLMRAGKKQRPPRIILITEHGKKDERPLRVVSEADVALLLDSLDVFAD